MPFCVESIFIDGCS